jgi:hypothetical protein
MEQVCTKPDYCEDSGKRKTEDYTRGGDTETEEAKYTSLEEQLSSLVSDTFLQLEQLILDFRELHLPVLY